MKLLKTLDNLFAFSICKKIIVRGIMDTKLFWHLYFWWGIRQAKKRRLANEARIAAMPKLTGEEWWEQQKK